MAKGASHDAAIAPYGFCQAHGAKSPHALREGPSRAQKLRPFERLILNSQHGRLDELFDGINRRGVEHGPDFITVDSGDGGSGAAPMSLIDCVGLPIQEGLPMVIDKLIEHGLRDRIKVIASGKLIMPSDVAWALCVGADFVASARGFMFALGCIQSLQCNKNTCPTGITTHNPRLQRGLDPRDKAGRIKSYVENMVGEVGVIAHACGVPEPRRLRRFHCRVVRSDGRSAPLTELYPEAQPHQRRPEVA